MEKQGNIKISSENMMPIIKKWLYSDKDIFLREIVANGIDAITKYKKLVDLGEAPASTEEYAIKVSVDRDAKTLTIEDNGIGMTEEEVEKYITQIAFSGAADFLDKYEKANGDAIIGHFGLGFYSAYMVADNVEIFTKSYQDAPAVHWESDGNSTYTIGDTDKSDRGTKIVLHIAANEESFLAESEIRGLIRKYCSFMPYPIYFNYTGKDDKPLNTPEPLYVKAPKDCTDEEYKAFYRDTFMDYSEPLFWVHLNMDYPFKLKGILYFPRVKRKMELDRGQVKLYCNQVFIADNIKEVIPEYLMLLNGVIDCPDIPLNVSRSFLQNDAEVQKITKHIVKKVADKLNALFKTDRATFEADWADIANFIKFGCLKDESFYDKVKDIIIYKNLDGVYKPLQEFIDGAEKPESADAAEQAAQQEGNAESEKKEEKEPEPKTVYYASDVSLQAQYVSLFKEAGLDAMVCDTFIDPHFISFLEYKQPGKVRFQRIDSDIDAALKSGETAEEESKAVVELFKSKLEGRNLTFKAEKLKNPSVPAVVNAAEFMRRMSEMNSFYGMDDESNQQLTMIINLANPVVSSLSGLTEEKQKFAIEQIYYLAMLAFRKLTPEEMDAFRTNTMKTLEQYIG